METPVTRSNGRWLCSRRFNMKTSLTRSNGRWLCLLLLCVQAAPCAPFTLDNLKALSTDIFTGYRKELRPVVDSNSPIMVSVAMWLTSIQDLNEISQQLTFSSLFMLEWLDPSLRWDPSHYNDTEYLNYPQKDMWIPDVTLQNSVESMKELGFDRNYLYIKNDGWVIWIVRGVFMTSCDIDVTYYPFDTQMCVIILTTLVSRKFELDLEISVNDSVSLEWYGESGTWNLLSVESTYVTDTWSRSRIAFRVTMKRLRLYYVVTIVIPVLFLSLTATLVFALPADSGEKMGTSITVLLAFAVYLTIVSDQMPRTSTQVSILAAYLTMLLGQTSLGVLLSVWILNLHFRDDKHPPGRRMRKLVLFLESLLCKTSKPAKIQPSDDEVTISDLTLEKKSFPQPEERPTSASSSDLSEVTWRHVAYIFDRALFYSFTVMLCLCSVVFLSLLLF